MGIFHLFWHSSVYIFKSNIVIFSHIDYFLKKKGGGKLIVKEAFKKIKKSNHLNRLVTLSPLTEMARNFHLRNGAKELSVNKETQNSNKDRNYNWTELCIQSSSCDSTKSNFNKDMALDEECQDRHDENELYDISNLNLVRFTDINNSIIAILTRIYKEKLKYFVDISKSNIMSNMREFIMHSDDCKTFTGENSTKEDPGPY